MTRLKLIPGAMALLLLSVGTSLKAADHPIGEPVVAHGMQIAAVYIQPTMMKPMLAGMVTGDIHLEADISATTSNQNGFSEGDWIPYLGISYRIEKLNSDWTTAGNLMPMVATDGPHYAANIKLDSIGKYRLSYHIDPPPYQGFYRHVDKETGVAEWWAPIETSWTFTYLGVGKKGGY